MAEQSTEPRLFRVILPVHDIEVAARFYGQIFDQCGERVSPGRHYFGCGGAILACYDPAADGDSYDPDWAFHENQFLYFSTDRLDDMRQRVIDAGATDVSPIETMPWGETLFYAVDPSGGRIAFVRADSEFTGSAD